MSERAREIPIKKTDARKLPGTIIGVFNGSVK